MKDYAGHWRLSGSRRPQRSVLLSSRQCLRVTRQRMHLRTPWRVDASSRGNEGSMRGYEWIWGQRFSLAPTWWTSSVRRSRGSRGSQSTRAMRPHSCMRETCCRLGRPCCLPRHLRCPRHHRRRNSTHRLLRHCHCRCSRHHLLPNHTTRHCHRRHRRPSRHRHPRRHPCKPSAQGHVSHRHRRRRHRSKEALC